MRRSMKHWRGIMGSRTLRKKITLHYRRGSAAHHCSECDYYVPDWQCNGIGGVDLGQQPRCKVMGLKPGRAYRIHPANICDAHDNSRIMERLRGWEI